MTEPGPGPAPGAAAAGGACIWHPDRATALACTRCGRPACPECLTPASVGFHCRACLEQARQTAPTRMPRTVAGARAGGRPVASLALIAVNTAIFLLTAVQARSAMDLSGSAWYLRGGLIPAEVASGEYWRLVTAGFLHGNLIHIAANMISLYVLGLPLERILGRTRFLVIYLVSLLGASASVMLFSAPVSLTIGASGAVYGLMGALLVTFKRLGYDLRQLVVLVVINIYITFQFAGISWQGHLGGLLVGAVLGAAMVYPHRSTRERWQWGSVAAILLVVVALVIVRDGQIGQWFCIYDGDGGVGCVPAH